MNLAILGLGGVGRVVAKTISRTGVYKTIVCADIDSKSIVSAVETIGSKIVFGQVVDASNSIQVGKLASSVNLLINATLPCFNLAIMKACLDHNCHYMDLACESLLKYPDESNLSDQLAMDEKFKNAGLLALCGIGADPGCSNIFARFLSDQLDSVEDIMVRDADVSYIQGQEPALCFSPDTFIAECCSEPPLMYENYSFIIKEPLHKIEEFVFPNPIGNINVYAVSHEEPWSIPRYLINKGIKNCNFGYGLSDDIKKMMDVLRILGLDSKEPINVKGVSVAPRDLVVALLPQPSKLAGKIKGYSCIGTLVRGHINGKEKTRFMYNITNHEEAYLCMQEQGSSYQAGIPVALAADLLAEGVIKDTGVLPPEALNPTPFINNLPKYGMEIVIEER